jgi:hypothetical protein
MSGAVKSQSRYPNLPGAGWTSEGTSELQCATSSDQLHQDAGGQQYCSEHLAVGHYEWGDHCSHGVVGGESVVGRVGEQGLDQWVDDKGSGVGMDVRGELDEYECDAQRYDPCTETRF